MQLSMQRTVSVSRKAATSCAVPRTAPRVVRVRAEQANQQVSTSEAAPVATEAPMTPAMAAPAGTVQNFQLLNSMTEAINGRAAMLGFVAAVVSEIATHQGVWSQMAGKYVDLELIEKPVGASPLGFAAVVTLITIGSLAPKMLEGLEANSKSFGPFTPSLELTLGRVAQMGFLGLVVLEAVSGSPLI